MRRPLVCVRQPAAPQYASLLILIAAQPRTCSQMFVLPTSDTLHLKSPDGHVPLRVVRRPRAVTCSFVIRRRGHWRGSRRDQWGCCCETSSVEIATGARLAASRMGRALALMLYSYLQRGAFTCREAGKLAVLYRVLYNAKFARGRVVSRRAAPALARFSLSRAQPRARRARGSIGSRMRPVQAPRGAALSN